ncbi:hypothetical protein B0I72DRAFT_131526 [Yarrowia lipolytica]|nr:hypothetical protein BKA91DRAFT_131337 [Yarrowia lipolytica]KAE8168888.1 hypothetical protein BKA90DRAFT_132112 [Yarrowia lipolytica]KAJ8053319.1 hypothetical protein LXG23DRAFT_37480 [Yarrowia lipolytica]RDW29867.1 hypothetical protein B0I72DRAFT_131526 [Yarrowia lipolytica]RDW37101.1 hypothetical protein B0I73DRAFT_143167 [Yarrowia lipolytica]
MTMFSPIRRYGLQQQCTYPPLSPVCIFLLLVWRIVQVNEKANLDDHHDGTALIGSGIAFLHHGFPLSVTGFKGKFHQLESAVTTKGSFQADEKFDRLQIRPNIVYTTHLGWREMRDAIVDTAKAPDWWLFVILIIMFVLLIVPVKVFPVDTPVWCIVLFMGLVPVRSQWAV